MDDYQPQVLLDDVDEEEALNPTVLKAVQCLRELAAAKKTSAQDPTAAKQRFVAMAKAWSDFNKFDDKVKRAAQDYVGGVRVGRRLELKSRQVGSKTKSKTGEEFFFKVTICGSGFGIWLEKEVAGADWQRLGGTAVSYYRDAGKGAELMLAGTGGTGTTGGKGLEDKGSNSIANLEVDAVAHVKAILSQAKVSKKTPLHFFLRAHSRGGVAGNQVVNELNSEYGNWDAGCTIELVSFDPVPGPANMSKASRAQRDDHYKETDVGEIDDSTVIYSVASGHVKDLPLGITKAAFKPQKVTGATRIIVTQQPHSAGKRKGFRYMGRIYTGTGVANLDPGVYVDHNEKDENSLDLVFVNTLGDFYKEVEEVRRAAHKKGRDPDTGREDIIDYVLSDYFFNKV
jgi:hypothetical protein